MNDSTEQKSWWQRLSGGLKRTSTNLSTSISDMMMRGPLSPERIVEIEEALIRADLGLDASAQIAEIMAEGRFRNLGEVQGVLATEVTKLMAPVAKPLAIEARKPFVILVVGVNGSGKTTTIGKLAARFHREGRSVMLAAGDTFRAAAIEQLKIWSGRAGASIVTRAQGSDPAGLAYDALVEARDKGIDVLLIDTAGRLQNRTELMDELEKIVRVLKKVDAGTPHAVLLVLDATVGQNALSQVEAFTKVAGITGLVMTKLDGTAKGGILVAVAAKFALPVHFIGVGESVDDLSAFDPGEFARALVGLGNAT
jgi:fused signal recognition particle receptor